MNGVILLASVVAIPANEIVIPTVLMLTVLTLGTLGVGSGAGVMFELDSVTSTGDLLRAGGWTQTRSARWTAVATLLPLAMGFSVCFLVTQVWRLVAG